MRIRNLTAVHVRIPLKQRVRHASHARSENDTLLVRCELDEGSVGWGEGLPRPYVTGETIATAWQHLRDYDFRSLGEEFRTTEDLIQIARGLNLRPFAGFRDSFGNAARCALELAILDAGCRALRIPFSQLISQIEETGNLCQSLDRVHYSAVMTATNPLKLRLRSWLYRCFGFRQCKVKVGVPGQNEQQLMRIVRGIMGPDVELRVDANEAWSPAEAVAKIAKLDAIPLQSIEQPVPHADVTALAAVRREVAVPIMLDESLCSLSDAERAVQEELCDAFNIRLSKCGGLIPSLQIARFAKDAGKTAQLGCQVGETGILSAAGRHFAVSIKGLTAIEGSFDRLLVREPLTLEDLTFGRAGRGDRLPGDGLGVTIDERAVQRVTVRSERYPV